MTPDAPGKKLANKIDAINELIALIQKKSGEIDNGIRRIGPVSIPLEDANYPELNRDGDEHSTREQTSLCSDLDLVITELRRLNTVSGNNLAMLNELI